MPARDTGLELEELQTAQRVVKFGGAAALPRVVAAFAVLPTPRPPRTFAEPHDVFRSWREVADVAVITSWRVGPPSEP